MQCVLSPKCLVGIFCPSILHIFLTMNFVYNLTSHVRLFFLQNFLKNAKKIAKSLDMGGGGGGHYNKNVAKLGQPVKTTFKIIEFTDNFGANYRVCR